MTSSWEWKQYQRMLNNATDRLCEEQSKDEHKSNKEVAERSDKDLR